MSFLQAVPSDDISALATELLERDRADLGYLPNYAALFAARPKVYQAWKHLNGAVKESMDLRRYELVTLAAATALRSSYCSLAHGRILAERFLPADEVGRIARDVDAAALDATDRAIVAFATKVTLHADQVTSSDIGDLRALGLSDEEVFDIVLAAAARCFFSKTLEATGVQPDHAYMTLAPDLREALTVGRPIAAMEPSRPC